MNKTHQKHLFAGSIDRRDFIQQTAALGVTSAIATAIGTKGAKASAPKKGGHLRQALRGGSTSDILEPTGAADTHQQNTSRQIFNNLTELLPDGTVGGELAESWSSTPDAATWEFKLRQGVEFHNGKSVEAQDVVDSINLHLGKDTKSSAKGLVSGVKEVKADGKNTVVFTLESGDSDLPYTLTDTHFVVMPAGTTDYEKGIGTGPFILKRWEPGVASETERNPNYFKEGLPYFDSVETINADDVTARQNALLTGKVDVIDDPDLNTLEKLSQEEGISIQETPGNKHFTLPMRLDAAPFDNNDVRMAMKLAIDREQILRSILNGHGYVGNDHPISRGMRFFNHDLPQRNYDIDKAKFHLKKAGHSSLDITIYASDIYAGGVDTVVLYKEHAAPAGINITVKRVPTDGYWSNIWNKVPICVSYWAGRPTANAMFSMAFGAQSTYNETNWNNEAFEKLLVSARAELDISKRQEMYSEMQRLVHFEGGLIAPVFANFVSANSDRVGMPEKLSSSWVLDGCKNTERWWFA